MNIKRCLRTLLNKAINSIAYHTTRVNSNRVMFVSFSGKSYSDNPKYISEALHQTAPSVEIIWGLQTPEKKKSVIPNYVKCCDMSTRLEKYRAYYSSAVIVSNFELPYIRKRPNQYFIQTWHGDRAFKKVLHDSAFCADSTVYSEEREGYCDLAVAGSRYGESQYRTAFKYKGNVLMQGTPRNDCLINLDCDKVDRVKRELGIAKGEKVVLYAPTLRRHNCTTKTAQQATVDIVATVEAIEKKYGCAAKCLVRAHPAITELALHAQSDKIINVSEYEDMAELMMASDILITDYSSCAGDFALLNRPVILFQSDIKEYLVKDREFYFNMSDSPYYIAETQEQLEHLILKLDEDEVLNNCKKILEFYGTCESGTAANCVAQVIVDHLNSIQ